MTLRQSFFTETKLNKIWNKTIEWNGYRLGTVMWHHNCWKLINDNSDFDTIKSDYKNEHSAAFHTQAELWNYIKELLAA
jgi:hypothetical protein